MKIFEQDIDIERLIELAEKEKIWIPEFQRPFEWDNSQVRLLIDSLFQDYNISSILLWSGLAELARRRVGGSVKDIKIPEQNTTEEVVYILDGQQRITALTYAFTNKDVYRRNKKTKEKALDIYWDTEYEGENPELRWVLGDEELDETDNENKKIVLNNYNQKEIFEKYSDRFVKIKHAYNWSNKSPEILKEMNSEADLFVKYNNKIHEIQKKIFNRHVYEMEQPGTLEQVLDVFVRINTQNTRLSIFDIMMAKTFSRIDNQTFNLREYINVINYKGRVKASYFDNLNEESIDLDNSSAIIDNADLLSVLTIMIKNEFLQKAILQLRANDLIENFKKLHDGFHELLAIFIQEFYVEEAELSKYKPLFRFSAGYFSHARPLNVEKKDFLKKWFWNTLLKNRYPGAQNEKIIRDMKYIAEADTLKEALNNMMQDNIINYTNIENAADDNPEYIKAYKSAPNKHLYRAMLLVLKSNGARDFYNGMVATKDATIKYALEEHHIFPDKSEEGKKIKKRYENNNQYEDIINNIANIALITKETNNDKISSKNPSEYIMNFEEEYKTKNKEDEFYQIMETQFITKAMIEKLKVNDFEGFMYDRTQALIKRINDLCKID